MITIDVEAQPARAERDHIERLIWGKFGNVRSGMSELMDAAERHGVRLTTFFDYAEQHLYGDSMVDVAREIHRRGHDLQLHLHPEFLSDDFYRKQGIGRVHNLNTASNEGAAVCAGFLAAAQHEVTGKPALAFRGGGYRFSSKVLRALASRGVQVDSSYNPSRATQPVHVGYLKQFEWDLGVFELPVSNVFAFSNPEHHLDYNFNASSLWGKSPIDCALRHRRYLDQFYAAYGEDAIAVLVLHSWSLLERDASGRYQYAGSGALERFEALLTGLEGYSRVIDSQTALNIMRSGAVGAKQDLELAEATRLSSESAVRPTDAAHSPPIVASTSSPQSAAAMAAAVASCPICGTPVADFEDFNGPKRRCTGCGSVERQRALASLIRNRLTGAESLAGKRLLLIAPSSSERRLLAEAGATQVITADVRPEVKPDLILDVCNMANVADDSFDVVLASYVLTCVHSLDRALSELKRVLKPGGLLLSSDPLARGRTTQEHTDEKVVTAWYGKEAFDKFRVGSFRTLGELDAPQLIGRFFRCETVTTQDAANGNEVVWFLSHKPVAADSSAGQNSVIVPEIGAARRHNLSVSGCTVCGDSLAQVADGQNCPKCKSRARLRALVPLLAEVLPSLGPSGPAAGKPLLGFAMTGAEIAQLAPTFPLRKSASLFGNYARDHELGVDVRDLSRYADSSFCGVFSSLLFDYFAEHDRALAECHRVIAPGGVLLTHIAAYRVLNGKEPPRQTGTIVNRGTTFDYLPADQALPDVKVGREWFLQALQRAGFEPVLVSVRDAVPGLICDWFIGIKPLVERVRPAPLGVPESALAVERASPGPSTTHNEESWSTASRELFKVIVPFGTSAGNQSYLVFEELTLPEGPPLALSEDSQVGGRREVVATDRARKRIYVSKDNGATFRRRYDGVDFPGMVRQTFTLASGSRIVKLDQSRLTYLFDAEDRLVATSETGEWNWAGAQGIGEAPNGTVLFAEYAAFKKGIAMQPLSVWRLKPQARNWEKVLTLPTAYEPPEGEIRHFHLCTPNPAKPTQWLLASGDKGRHNRLWTSDDDGDSWDEVAFAHPLLSDVQPHRAPGAIRLTQINATDDGELVWGSDDTLGAGRAVLMGLKLVGHDAKVRHLGWSGPNAVRNVLKLGPQLFMFLGEAKGAGLAGADCVLLDTSTGRQLNLVLPNLSDQATTTTDSLGSTRLLDGLAFFPILGGVLTNSRAGMLRLRVEDAESKPVLSTGNPKSPGPPGASVTPASGTSDWSSPSASSSKSRRASLARPRFQCNPLRDYGIEGDTRACFWDNARQAFALQQEVAQGQALDVALHEISQSFDLKVKLQARSGSGWVDRLDYQRVEVEGESLDGIRYRYFPRPSTQHLLVVFQAMNTTPGYNYIGTLKSIAASRLYIKDDYGEDEKTRSSYYLGARRGSEVSQGVRHLIREALLDLGLRPQHVTMGGSSKGAFAALFHGYALNVGHIVAGGPQVLLGNFLNSRSPSSVLPPILRYLAGDLSPESVAWANGVLFEQLSASSRPYPNVIIHVGQKEPHYEEHVRPLLNWLASHGLPAPTLDLGDYTTHAELDRHFPGFFREQCEKIAGIL